MQLKNDSIEPIDYLHTPENSKLFKKLQQMVQLLLAITITAMTVMAIQLYLSIK